MGNFSIEATDLSWINGEKDDPEDLCLHGHAVAKIGDRTLAYDATVSATALYLLKTIREDHFIHKDNQMLPCCGFFMIPDKNLSSVTIIGCDNGIDWSVIHEGNSVKLILEDGYEDTVAIEDYKAEVFRFADFIEAFYSSCTPKTLPKDEFDRNGYTAFWNEWHRRRNPLKE